ncbi:MAG: hypothetical protein ABSG42_02760 [Nitrospirota bacterium]
MRRFLHATLIFAAMLTAQAAAFADSYVITLANGNKISANAYQLEGTRIVLKYPVGEARLPVSQVVSVTEDGRGVELFQAAGAQPLQKSGPEVNRPETVKTGIVNINPGATSVIPKGRSEDQHETKEPKSNMPVNTGGGTGSNNIQPEALADMISSSNEASRAEAEQQLDQMLKDYNEGKDTGSGR